MLKLLNKDINLLLILLTIFLNYIFFIPDNFDLIIKINFIFFIFFSFLSLINYENNKCLQIFIFLIILINLGTVTISWDARSIWIFKAKQIFFENSILHIKNNYASFSNLQYPNIVPAFNAGFAKLIGHWNEIFPKLGNTLILIPGFIIFSRNFKNNYFLLSIIFTIFTLGKLLIDGTLDGLLSLYFVSCVLILCRIKNSYQKNYNYMLLFGFSVILTLLKMEGFFLLISIIISILTLSFIEKKFEVTLLYVFIFSLIPSILWYIYCYTNLINESENQNIFNLISFYQNISLFENYLLIFKYLLLNEKFLLGLLFFTLSIFYTKKEKNNYFNFVILISFIYLIFLFFVYMSTTLDIEWHLNSSATRVIKPISLLLLIFSIYNITTGNLKS